MPELFPQEQSTEVNDTAQQQQAEQPANTQITSQAEDTQSNAEENWINSIVPEEYREAGWINRHTSKDEFFKSMMNLNQLIGKKLTPNSDDPQIMAEFRQRMGIPENPDGYEIELPEGFEANEESLKAFKELAHKANIQPDLANEIYKQGIQEVQKSIEVYEMQKEAEIDKAFNEFAKDPNFKEISVNVTNLLNKVDPNGEILTQQDLSELGVNAPKVARLLNKIYEQSGNDTVIGASKENFGGVGSREEQISKIMDEYKAGRISLATADARREQINRAYGL